MPYLIHTFRVSSQPFKANSRLRRSFVRFWPMKNREELADGPTLYVRCRAQCIWFVPSANPLSLSVQTTRSLPSAWKFHGPKSNRCPRDIGSAGNLFSLHTDSVRSKGNARCFKTAELLVFLHMRGTLSLSTRVAPCY